MEPNNQNNLEKSVTNSLDGKNENLYPYFSYLLQDLWEIGASPAVIIKLLKNHADPENLLQVLDLGCGKGAVSIQLAQHFNCHCLGIDAYSDFIESADEYAEKHQVRDKCTFKVGDIMRILGIFFWIIIGAILLWFFAMNLDQYVTIQFFQATYEDVNLIVVIFITFFIGTVVGAILLSTYVMGARAEVRLLKKERRKLLEELDGLRNMSIEEIPDVDTRINPLPKLNSDQE